MGTKRKEREFVIIDNNTSSLILNNVSVLVDTEDVTRLKQYGWREVTHGKSIRIKGRKYGDGLKEYFIHRVILNVPDDKIIDHINHDPLDNRKVNLRICSFSENNQNREKVHSATSKYKGVHWNKKSKKWHANITNPKTNKLISLGYFEDENLAAIAYDNAAINMFGEYAHINIK